jgi:lipoate---protein ligase
MFCIYLEETDLHFCLAAEEYLLKNYREEIFLIWQSNNAVVVGKHQNTLAEIDYRYIRENGISVARRISGGGTVFIDSGNVNFVLIVNVSSPSEVSFQKFTQPVVDALSDLGIHATLSGRNDLMIEGKKISGNAEHVFKNRVLHHGTLLFNSDLARLGKALGAISEKYTGKAIRSYRSEVTNISCSLKKTLSVREFIRHMLDFQLNRSGESLYYSLPESDKEAIRKLSSEKFQTREWQYGYSPSYSFRNTLKIKEKTLNISIEAEKGIIQRVSLEGDYYSKKDSAKLAEILIHQPHQYESIENAHLRAGIITEADVMYSYF